MRMLHVQGWETRYLLVEMFSSSCNFAKAPSIALYLHSARRMDCRIASWNRRSVRRRREAKGRGKFWAFMERSRCVFLIAKTAPLNCRAKRARCCTHESKSYEHVQYLSMAGGKAKQTTCDTRDSVMCSKQKGCGYAANPPAKVNDEGVQTTVHLAFVFYRIGINLFCQLFLDHLS